MALDIQSVHMASDYWTTVCVCVRAGPATVHSGIMDMYVGPLVRLTAECAANGNASATF